MFNWTTTTIINSLKDYTTGNDLAKVWKAAEPSDEPKAGFSGQYPVLKIKRDLLFESRYIQNVYKAIGTDAVLCKVTIRGDKLLDKVKPTSGIKDARLAFYIGLEGSEESVYANDWYQKGKPFSIGFEVSSEDTPAKLIARIKGNADKFGIANYGKKMFDITISGNNLIITGTHEFLRFKTIAVAVTDDLGLSETIVDYKEDGVTSTDTDTSIIITERGKNGFGTYSYLVHNLRVPTVHNTKFWLIKEDEVPVIGAKYDQYIVTYCAPSMANPGFTVIGQHNMSVTTHVFWVKKDVSANFAKLFSDETTGLHVPVISVTGGAKVEAGSEYAQNHEQTTKDTPTDDED